jgi:hypothetical protein
VLRAGEVDFYAPNSVGDADPYGHLTLWRELGMVDFGNSLAFPLRVKFSTDPGNNGVLGYGFWLPLLEGRAYLLDQQTLKATIQCGKSVYFWRSQTDPTQFVTPDKAWHGALNDDGDFTMVSNDGWTLAFKGGKISELKTPAGRALDWEYEGGIAKGIKEGGKMLLSTTWNDQGLLESLSANGQTYRFAYDKRPRLQILQKQTLVAALEPTLNQITWPDGSAERFTFGMTDERVPTLVFKGKDQKETSYSWNASTNKILTGGDWRYSVNGGGSIYESPSFSRKDSAGHTESLTVDSEHGTATQIVNGVKTVWQTFTAPGPLDGLTRDISQTANGKTRDLLRAAYNEKGQLVRMIKEDQDGNQTITTYTDKGAVASQEFQQTTDANALTKLQEQEKTLLESVATALLDQKQQKLKDLANFYFFTENKLDKARQIVAQMDDASSYGIKVQLVFYDHTMTVADKIQAYEALAQTYPNTKDYLNHLIDITQNEGGR